MKIGGTARCALAAVAVLAVAAAAMSAGREALATRRAVGASRDELRRSVSRAVAASSPRAAGGLFHNTLPDEVVERGSALYVLRALLARGPGGHPAGPVPLGTAAALGPAAALSVTWYGHASVLLEIDGTRVLADPVWGNRASPSHLVGPRRLHPVPLPLAALPEVDAIVISHDHYDHLDMPTVRSLLTTQSAPFVVPLGVGEHLRRWRVPESRIVELDWSGAVTIGSLKLICTEARHFSGRGLARNTTLWSSWALIGPQYRVFLAGDTGYTPAFADIADAHGPFDLTVLPIGSYGKRWPYIHMTPEQAVQAHQDLTDGGRGLPPRLLVPMHWATFNLGLHRWSEPAQRLVVAAEKAGVPLAVPRPGERIDATAPAPVTDWWSAVSH
jgi:L-ascorbate metabolism protein UlaG (beta-lactamase superfamily)